MTHVGAEAELTRQARSSAWRRSSVTERLSRLAVVSRCSALVPGRSPCACVVARVRALDLDDVGAEVRRAASRAERPASTREKSATRSHQRSATAAVPAPGLADPHRLGPPPRPPHRRDDVLRGDDARGRWSEALDGDDRLVILGDGLELREAADRARSATRRPVLRGGRPRARAARSDPARRQPRPRDRLAVAGTTRACRPADRRRSASRNAHDRGSPTPPPSAWPPRPHPRRCDVAYPGSVAARRRLRHARALPPTRTRRSRRSSVWWWA